MPITRLTPPPINVDANDFTFKKWFTDIYNYTQGGVLVPNASVIPSYGFRRNLIINGDFQVWQRGVSFTNSGVTALYGADRWCIGRTSAAAGSTFNRVNIPTASGILPIEYRYHARVQRTSGDTSTADVNLVQCIESATAVLARSKTVVLSYWARKGSGFSAASFLVRLFTGTGTDENILSVSLTGLRTPLSAAVTDLSTEWKYYSHSCTLNADTNEINVAFTYHTPANATAVGNEYFDIEGVQLEVASNPSYPKPTAFELETFDSQLLRCSRFYQKSFDYSVVPAQNTVDLHGALVYQVQQTGVHGFTPMVYLPVKMRTSSGTFTFYNYNAANNKWRNFSLGADSATPVVSSQGEKSFGLLNAQVAGDTNGNFMVIHWSLDSELV